MELGFGLMGERDGFGGFFDSEEVCVWVFKGEGVTGGGFGVVDGGAEFIFGEEELEIDWDFAGGFVFLNGGCFVLVSGLFTKLLCVGVEMIIFAGGWESVVVGDEIAFDFWEHLGLRLMRMEFVVFERLEFGGVDLGEF